MSKKIIIAHFKENLNWIRDLSPEYDVEVYSKTSHEYNFVPATKGNEATSYCKYIIDNYDNLGKYNLFFHGHHTSYHQDIPSVKIANNLNWDLSPYFSVNRRDWYFHNGMDNKNMLIHMESSWKDLFGEYLKYHERFFHYSGAQFQVRRDLILRNPKSFYEHIYNWLEATTVPEYYSGRILEHTWHYIFTGSHIEDQHDNILRG